MAVPLAIEVSAAPVFSAILAVEPAVVVMAIALLPALIDPNARDWLLLKIKAPMVPVVEIAPTEFFPVRLIVPAPLLDNVAAVMTPAPIRLAPATTEVVAVPAPTFRLPARFSVPALTVVVPV